MRIVRACRDLELASVAVYSEHDRTALHVRLADEAVAIGPSTPAESYLRVDRIMAAAAATGADAVHPGYGFLAENPALADACVANGLTFIGPPGPVMALLGSKTAARRAAQAAGLPLVPGTLDPLDGSASDGEILRAAGDVGYPVMVKAVAGGGGKGMRLVRDEAELLDAVQSCRSEAMASFDDDAVYMERWIARPRHVEVQVLGDQHGTMHAFVERECSIQRRHQKLVEETPSPSVAPALRRALLDAAARLASSVGYVNAGTVEFLLDADGRFYFLEMNTRLQVEHGVTEMVTGIDLVEWQIRIARGEALTLDPDRLVAPHGHAIECRISAEDPDAGFLPSPGRIEAIDAPSGPGIRNDSGVETGAEIPVYYDPLISKLMAWGGDRAQAISRMRRALREYHVSGPRTTVPFFRWLLHQKAFERGDFHTGSVDTILQERSGEGFVERDPSLAEVALMATALGLAMRSHDAAGSPVSAWAAAARREGLRG